MTENRLLDYSFQHPRPAQIKAAGASGVMRYLSRSSPPKTVTASEVAALHAAELSVGLVFEDGAGRAKAGHAAGSSDAGHAYHQAAALGAPAGTVVFFAVDFDTTASAVADYFRGVASVRGAYAAGIYGSLRVVDGIMAAGIVHYGWQTVAWSGGRVSTRAHLYQRNHFAGPYVAGCDENILLKPFPLWTVAHARPAVKPAVHPTPRPTPKPAGPAAKTYRWRTLPLKAGSTGADVKHLQARLHLTADGTFGPKTRAAVVAFQKANHLTPDGVCGRLTAAKIG